VGAYSTPPDPLAGFKGAYFSGEGGGRREGGRELRERGKRRGRKGVREREVEGEGVNIAWPDL